MSRASIYVCGIILVLGLIGFFLVYGSKVLQMIING